MALASIAGVAASEYLRREVTDQAPPDPMGGLHELAEPTEILPIDSLTLSSGDRLLRRVLETLERRPVVASRVRQRIHLDDQELSGAGVYFQKGVGKQRRTRWEIQSRGTDGAASLLQVLEDGRYLWTDRLLNGRRRVTRVDLNRLRTALYSQPRDGNSGVDVDPELAMVLSRGGLSQLIAELSRQMQFALINSQSTQKAEWLTLVGRWKPSALNRIWPHADAEGSRWPKQLPQRVVLQVKSADLFPYVIEYHNDQGSDASTAAGDDADGEPLGRFEFYEVQFAGAVDDRHFAYAPGAIQWSDVTSDVLRRLRTPAIPAMVAVDRTKRRPSPR
ncbi:MAG: hypothetical protein AAF961_00955 [Planctomycetota bacterium]